MKQKHHFRWLALLTCLLMGFATMAHAQETDDLQAYLDQLAAEMPAQQPTGHRPVRRNNPPEPPTSYATVNLSQFDSYQNRTKVLQVKSNVKFVNGIISAASSFSGGTPLLQVMSSAQVIIDETSGVNASATNSQACTSAVSIEGSSTLFQYAAITAPANGTGVAVNIASSGSALVCGGTVNGQINNPGNGTIYYFEGPTEAYAVLSTDHKTLSFYYDGKKNQRTGTIFTEESFVKTADNCYWGSWSNNSSITTVNIDPTFADYDGLTSTAYWFFSCYDLTTINGLQYLNTANITNMNYMFKYCSGLTSLDLSSFNTANVTDMSWMFSNCSGLTSLDLSSFNTANVTDMSYMFIWCLGLTCLDLSSFNTANVTYMNYMFWGCSGLTTIYISDQWTTDNVSSSASMFYNCTSLVGGDGTTFNPNYTDKTKAYAGIGGYLTMKGQETEDPEAYAVLSTDGKTLSFYYDNQKNSQVGTIYTADQFRTENMNGWGYRQSNFSDISITTVNFSPSFADFDGLTSTAWWFYKCMNLTTINGLQYLNTANVTDMSYMFGWCSGLTSLDLSNFNTANVTDMSYMFHSCYNLTSLNVSSFNTANVTNMRGMFLLSDSHSMLTSLDVTNFNTAKVTDMGGMFGGCSITSLDLTSFNTANVTDMHWMFSWCYELTTIYISDLWTVNNVTESTYMFGCINLVGGDGTVFNPNYDDKTKAYAGIGGYLTMEGQNDDDLQNYLDMLKIDTEDWWSESWNNGSYSYSYHRQFYTDCWQTLYVPFTMSYSEWKDNFEVARLIGCDQYDTNGDGINDYHELMASVMGSGSTTSANYPYLIRAKAKNATVLTLNKQEGDKYADSHVFTGGNFQYIAHGNYGLQADMHGGGAYRLRGGAFSIPESDEEVLPPYRWYLTLQGPQPQQVKVRLVGDELPSGISDAQQLRNNGASGDDIFDLQGRRVTNCKSGVYIVNGKKRLVK